MQQMNEMNTRMKFLERHLSKEKPMIFINSRSSNENSIQNLVVC